MHTKIVFRKKRGGPVELIMLGGDLRMTLTDTQARSLARDILACADADTVTPKDDHSVINEGDAGFVARIRDIITKRFF